VRKQLVKADRAKCAKQFYVVKVRKKVNLVRQDIESLSTLREPIEVQTDELSQH